MKLLINALLPTSSTALRRVNMLFDEKIIRVSADEIDAPDDTEVIDAQGLMLLPGGVDPHVHILGKAATAAKDVEKVSKAALEGGWTTLAELSYHTEEPVFDPSRLKSRKELFDKHSYVDMALWGQVDITDYPYHAEAAQELWGKGVVGISLCAPSPNPAVAEISFTEIMDLFLDIYESDTAFAFQGYDHELYPKYSFESQRDAVKKILRRMQENPIHIPRVPSWGTIEFINSISKRSDISYALCFADLIRFYHPEAKLPGYDFDFSDPENLLPDLIRTNKIYLLSNCSASNPDKHAACELFEGQDPQGLLYSYLWVLSELYTKRKVPLATCIKMTSENAAKRMGLYPVKGSLDKGADADFVLYDPHGKAPYASPDPLLEITGCFSSVYLRGEQVAGINFKTRRKGAFVVRHTNPKRRYNNTTWI